MWEGQAVRLLSFRMRLFVGMGHRARFKYNLFKGLQPGSSLINGFRSKASLPDRLSRLAAEVGFR